MRSLRAVDFLDCFGHYGVAVGEFLASTMIPSVAFITVRDPCIFIGRQLRTTKINIKKAYADGYKIRRQNTRGKAVMMQDNQELTITIGIGDFEKYGHKSKVLFRYFCEVINAGTRMLGINTGVSDVTKFPSKVVNQDCMSFVDVGDICTIQQGVKISAATYIVRNGYFQLDCIINITNKSNLAPYLEKPEERFETTSIEKELGHRPKTDWIVSRYKLAFQDAMRIYEDNFNLPEEKELTKLVYRKYLTDDWIYGKWQV